MILPISASVVAKITGLYYSAQLERFILTHSFGDLVHGQVALLLLVL
jgi:hypothetical protein